MTMFISCVQYCHEQMYYFHYCFSVVPWYQERYILSVHDCSSYRELNMLITIWYFKMGLMAKVHTVSYCMRIFRLSVYMYCLSPSMIECITDACVYIDIAAYAINSCTIKLIVLIMK